MHTLCANSSSCQGLLSDLYSVQPHLLFICNYSSEPFHASRASDRPWMQNVCVQGWHFSCISGHAKIVRSQSGGLHATIAQSAATSTFKHSKLSAPPHPCECSCMLMLYDFLNHWSYRYKEFRLFSDFHLLHACSGYVMHYILHIKVTDSQGTGIFKKRLTMASLKMFSWLMHFKKSPSR